MRFHFSSDTVIYKLRIDFTGMHLDRSSLHWMWFNFYSRLGKHLPAEENFLKWLYRKKALSFHVDYCGDWFEWSCIFGISG